MAKAAAGRQEQGQRRRSKKKTSILTIEKVEYVDYMRTSTCFDAHVRSRQDPLGGHGQRRPAQREVARAIKNAREMALLPYIRHHDAAAASPIARSRPR
jgi:ribosomal protein S18